MTWPNYNLESKNSAKAVLSFEKRDVGEKEEWCMLLHVNDAGHHTGQFPQGCSGKRRCGARARQTLPDCTDDSTELQSHLYGNVIQGWFMATGRRGLSRERTRAVSFSEMAPEKINRIHTEFQPLWMAIVLWSVETDGCVACLNGDGLEYVRNNRAGALSHAGEMQRVLLFALYERGHIRTEASHLRN